MYPQCSQQDNNISEDTVLVLVIAGFYKVSLRRSDGVKWYDIQSNTEIGSGVQVLLARTHREQGDLITLFFLFFFKIRKGG
jgi:hypothetical protein